MTFRRESPYRGHRLGPVEAALEKFATSRLGYQYLLHLAPKIDKVVIPRTHGRISATGLNKVGLVTTTGAKSGQQRTQPLVLVREGETLLAIGSNYGRPPHPGWSANLLANPECTVEFQAPPAPYRARLLEGVERERAWETAVDFYAGYALYEKSCAPRVIRLFRLTPS